MRCIVCGAGGFIGWHLVRRLKAEGHYVIGIDRKHPEFAASQADEFFKFDLTISATSPVWGPVFNELVFEGADEVYQLAAEVGGLGYIYDAKNDADMLRSALINFNVLEWCRSAGAKRVLYTSSACVYPDSGGDGCKEDSVYPAGMDNEYAWEKLYSERLYQAYARVYGTTVRIARLHNCYGPYGHYDGGREKAPAAICRKIALAEPYTDIEVWGDGTQKRSFMYVDDAVTGIIKLMRSDCEKIVNIGSAQLVTINQLIETVCYVAGKQVTKKYVDGPVGVHGRNSDNARILHELGWAPATALHVGLRPTYEWIEKQLQKKDGHETVVAETTGGDHVSHLSSG